MGVLAVRLGLPLANPQDSVPSCLGAHHQSHNPILTLKTRVSRLLPAMHRTTYDLFEAAKGGSRLDAATAIAFGAEINAKNVIGFTPLHYACWRRAA